MRGGVDLELMFGAGYMSHKRVHKSMLHGASPYCLLPAAYVLMPSAERQHCEGCVRATLVAVQLLVMRPVMTALALLHLPSQLSSVCVCILPFKRSPQINTDDNHS